MLRCPDKEPEGMWTDHKKQQKELEKLYEKKMKELARMFIPIEILLMMLSGGALFTFAPIIIPFNSEIILFVINPSNAIITSILRKSIYPIQTILLAIY